MFCYQVNANRQNASDCDLKSENAQLKNEQVAANNKVSRMQKAIEKAEAEKKDGLHKIQAMNIEMKQLRMKLEEFEASKAADIKRLEASLTESLKSNKKVADNLDQQIANISEDSYK